MGTEFVPSLDVNPSVMEVESGVTRCSHYKRRCKIRAPCCSEIFDCRHCHNEAKNSMEVDPLDRHDIPRHEVAKAICSICNTEQDVQQNCINCGVCMGKYFCANCKFFDDDVSKGQYHCDGCGICRIGGEENFFHCEKCACCYSNLIKDEHRCVKRAMHHNCPVCFVCFTLWTHNTLGMHERDGAALPSFGSSRIFHKYVCPVCSKSICDMSILWKKLDEEIAATPMPASYQNKMVWILCNHCGTNSNIQYHIVALKCPCYKSYNTRQTGGGPSTSCPTWDDRTSEVKSVTKMKQEHRNFLTDGEHF